MRNFEVYQNNRLRLNPIFVVLSHFQLIGQKAILKGNMRVILSLIFK